VEIWAAETILSGFALFKTDVPINERNQIMKRIWVGFLCLLMFCVTPSVWAEGEEEGVPAEEYVGYVELKPFIVNFGGPGKTRFLKCEISISVGSESTMFAVNHHMAQIRNDLVFLLSAQTEETVNSVQAQTELAQSGLKLVQSILVDEVGEAMVNDLFFTSFVVQ
jgi:flagellar FliL protein